MLYITAIIKGKADTSQEFLNLFKPLVTATRNEEGCQRYEVQRSTSESDTYIMLEEWESNQSIEQHNQSEHFQGFAAAVQILLAEPLQIYVTEKVL